MEFINFEEMAEQIESMPGGDTSIRKAMDLTGKATKEEALRSVFGLTMEMAELSGNAMAWRLADGRYVSLVIGALGYDAALYDNNYRQISVTEDFCATGGCSPYALAALAAEELHVDLQDADRVNYGTLMAAVESVSEADGEGIMAAMGLGRVTEPAACGA